jgi:hypothetical protein
MGLIIAGYVRRVLPQEQGDSEIKRRKDHANKIFRPEKPRY